MVRNTNKGLSPFPVATYVTCDHMTSSILYFLTAFQTDHAKIYGHKNVNKNMIICDGSMVLMQAISLTFCQTNLNALLQSYLNILMGKGTAEDVRHPILHRLFIFLSQCIQELQTGHACVWTTDVSKVDC